MEQRHTHIIPKPYIEVIPKELIIKDSINIFRNGIYLPEALILSEKKIGSCMLLAPTMIEEAPKEGIPVILLGTSYILFNKEYDLRSGYGIAAIAYRNCVIPILRESKGYEYAVPCKVERTLHKTEYTRINTIAWLNIVPIQDHNVIKENLHPIVYELLEIGKYFRKPLPKIKKKDNV